MTKRGRKLASRY